MSEGSNEGAVPSYAGDVSPQDAFSLLREDPAAQLIDVRTRAEWSFVGFTNLASLNKDPVFVEWQMFPSMDVNPAFVKDIEQSLSGLVQAELAKDTPLLFLCRSGVRSVAAAKALTSAGYSKCFNVLEGFEGDLDDQHHRSQTGGWKAGGLPWAQR